MQDSASLDLELESPTPEIEEKLVLLLQSGNDLKVAGQAVGVDPEVLEFWIASNRYPKFNKAVAKARALAEANLVSRVQQAAAGGSWQAAAWLLERGFSGWTRPTADQKNAKAAEPPPGADPFAELDNVTELRPRRSNT